MTLLLLAACFSGVKYAREGETCKSGDQLFEGAVSCAGGLRCLTIEQYRADYRRGRCLPACGPDAPCAAGSVCAAGVCVLPCLSRSSCLGELDTCCLPPVPGQPAACLSRAACEVWGSVPDAGVAGFPDAGGEAGS